MGDSDNLDQASSLPVNQEVGKLGEYQSASAECTLRPAAWSLADEVQRPIDFGGEAEGCVRATLKIAVECGIVLRRRCFAGKNDVPLGLKAPFFLAALGGTAKAVPFPNQLSDRL